MMLYIPSGVYTSTCSKYLKIREKQKRLYLLLVEGAHSMVFCSFVHGYRMPLSCIWVGGHLPSRPGAGKIRSEMQGVIRKLDGPPDHFCFLAINHKLSASFLFLLELFLPTFLLPSLPPVGSESKIPLQCPLSSMHPGP